MNRIIRKRWLPLVLVGTVGAICYLIGVDRADPAKAKVQDGSVRGITYSGMQLVWLGPSETVEICVGTLSSRAPDLKWRGVFLDNLGNKLLQLPEKSSPAGTWTCSKVPRTAFGVGDSDTGRIKLAAHLFVEVPAGTQTSEFVGAFDIAGAGGETVAGGLIFWAVTHDND